MKLQSKGFFIFGGLIVFVLLAANLPEMGDKIKLQYPEYWPKPTYDFTKNPLTKQGVALGRQLFYETNLSIDNTTSCSSCHLSYTAFTHVDHQLSHGIKDRIGNRNSPALMNLAWANSFMWDGAVHHLDVQALAPISDTLEMGEDLANVISKLQKTTKYPTLFKAAYGDSIITGEHLLKALAQFQLTLVSANSKYDKVMRKEEDIAFTEQEQNGYAIFKKNCNSCHQEPLFTTGGFANNGLAMDTILNDLGRMRITKKAADSLKFKIPTLRNIEFSFPYMHDGRFRKLSNVLTHYTKGIQHSPTLAPELQDSIKITHREKVDLTAFLLTLSDKDFLFNKAFTFPREN